MVRASGLYYSLNSKLELSLFVPHREILYSQRDELGEDLPFLTVFA